MPNRVQRMTMRSGVSEASPPGNRRGNRDLPYSDCLQSRAADDEIFQNLASVASSRLPPTQKGHPLTVNVG